LHDGRDNEIAVLRVVNHVHEHPALAGICRHLTVGLLVVCRGDGEKSAVEDFSPGRSCLLPPTP